MDYNSLLAGLLSINRNDVAGLHRLGQLLLDLSDASTLQLLNNIQDLEKVIIQINRLENTVIPPGDSMTQRGRFLDRIERLSESEGNVIAPFGTHPNEPYFNRFDMIYCHFGGVGSEYDEPHYAMVWEDDHSEADILIIPSTSQYSGEYVTEFSVGQINGLPRNNTILCVEKMMRISRKRVIKHRHGHYIRGTIPAAQQNEVRERIEFALAIWLYGEVPLEEYVRNQTTVALPVDFLTHYQRVNFRFTPVRDVRWVAANQQLHYRIWNEDNTRMLQFKYPKTRVTVTYKQNRIYDGMFSDNTRLKSAALSEFTRLYV